MGSRTTLVSLDSLPGEIKGVEPGKIRLKSRCGKVDVPIPDSIVIGREQGDVVLRWDSSSSRTHSRVFYDRGQIWVEDLGSSNGTWLNQHRLTEKRVFNRGDNLLVGKTEFYLE
jgi:pSer/pThr/pTyr-binding forkhead associated (FHA) protein